MRPSVMLAVAIVIAAGACGHAPQARTSSAERALTSVADIAGAWVASDDRDWGYRLTIDAAGAFDQVIDRGKLGRCEQKGTLAAGDAAKRFTITFAKNECDRDGGGAPVTIEVASFTGERLVLVVSAERHDYQRAPAQ